MPKVLRFTATRGKWERQVPRRFRRDGCRRRRQADAIGVCSRGGRAARQLGRRHAEAVAACPLGPAAAARHLGDTGASRGAAGRRAKVGGGAADSEITWAFDSFTGTSFTGVAPSADHSKSASSCDAARSSCGGAWAPCCERRSRRAGTFASCRMASLFFMPLQRRRPSRNSASRFCGVGPPIRLISIQSNWASAYIKKVSKETMSWSLSTGIKRI